MPTCIRVGAEPVLLVMLFGHKEGARPSWRVEREIHPVFACLAKLCFGWGCFCSEEETPFSAFRKGALWASRGSALSGGTLGPTEWGDCRQTLVIGC